MAAPYVQPSDKPISTASYACLKGKVAFVTGSSSGIGAATAVAFVKNGAKVALHGRNLERLQKVREFCLKQGAKEDQVFAVSGDLTKPEVIEKIVKDTVNHFGGIDILVNNAGAGDMKPFEQSSPDFVDQMYKTNTRSVYHLTQLALPYLKKAKGSVVIVSSIAGKLPMPGAIGYSMAKSMTDMFAKSLALDLAKDGVRVNIISPGGVRTGIMRPLLETLTEEEKDKRVKETFDAIAGIHPLHRCAWSEEVAQAILFLASDVSSFVTGHDFVFDGGATLTSSSNFLNPDNIKTD